MRNGNLILALLFFILIIPANAQDDELDNLNFDTEPLQQEPPPYFGIGGGYLATFHFANFDDLNTFLSNNNFQVPEFEAPVFLSGAHGFTGIPWIPNLRVGFYGMSGVASSEAKATVNNADLDRTVDYTLVFTGFSVDYGIVLFKSVAVLPGIGLGWSNLQIDTYQGPVDIEWGNITPGQVGDSFFHTMERSAYYIQPNIDIEFALQDFLMIKLNGGYTLNFAESDWQFNNISNLNGVPDGINKNGPYAQIGLYIGLFNY